MWWSRRALLLHATIIVLIPAFIALCWWQVDRALGGNGLSWAYVFEWPFFAVYALYMWWKLVHEDAPSDHASAGGGADPGPDRPTPDEGSDEAAAYNRYLAALEASGHRKHW